MPISRIETASLDSALVAPTATALTTASGSAPSYSARAWVNFNGTGTVAIRASGNVSSITDNGVGRYFVNFSVNMPDANYSVVSTCNGDAYVQQVQATNSTSLAYVAVNNTGNAGVDSTGVCVAIFR